MKRYTLKDFGRAMGMTSPEVAAYKKQCAWNKKMARILATKPGDPEPPDEAQESEAKS